MISNVFKGWFTASDNCSFEIGRALWALSMIALCASQGYALWKGQTFSPTEFGTGAAAILAAGGFGIATKDKANQGGTS